MGQNRSATQPKKMQDKGLIGLVVLKSDQADKKCPKRPFTIPASYGSIHVKHLRETFYCMYIMLLPLRLQYSVFKGWQLKFEV